ncbi:hypothetical protein ACH46L_18410 [Streptomyces althioticus]|uniref:hypothetical protein n=1 Tax=Streptomyces althioticus TaxID=83380 RepID=UPI0036BAAC11
MTKQPANRPYPAAAVQEAPVQEGPAAPEDAPAPPEAAEPEEEGLSLDALPPAWSAWTA